QTSPAPIRSEHWGSKDASDGVSTRGSTGTNSNSKPSKSGHHLDSHPGSPPPITAIKPPVGSGYLLSGDYDYFEESDTEPPPPPPLAFPLTSTTLNNQGDLSRAENRPGQAVDTNKISKVDTSVELAVNEEKIKNIIQGETHPRMEIQTEDRIDLDVKEDVSDARLTDFEGNNKENLDQLLHSSNTVLEEEHIGLEHVKRMEEEAEKRENPSISPTKSTNEGTLNSLNNLGKQKPQFSPGPGSKVDGGSGNRNNDNFFDNQGIYEDESNRNYGTNSNSGVQEHRNTLENSTPNSGGNRKLSKDGALMDRYGSNDGGQFPVVRPTETQDSLPDDFINVGFDDIQKPMEDMKRDEREKHTKGSHLVDNGEKGVPVDGFQDRQNQDRKNDDNDLFGDDFVDYKNYEDPYYGYDYDYSPNYAEEEGTQKASARQSSAFLGSPFESMFGKTVDQTRKGSFGSLFQNLGQSQRSRGRTNSDGGRGLFDDKLGQIIKSRPSLNLFNG
ncbi:hypothetical protein EGW08_010361, partial [Elysia chlorotica]